MSESYEERVTTEHEAALNSDKEAFEQSESDRKLVKRIEKIFEMNKAHREKYDNKWLDYYKMFRGRQWKEERPAYRHSEVLNMVFQTIQSVIPIMTDTRPKFEYLPQDPLDSEFAEIMNHLADYDWTRNNWLYQVASILYDGHIYGTAFGSCKWNPESDDGLGAIEIKSEDTFHFFPSPSANDMHDDREFCFARPMDIQEIKRRWPKKGKSIKPDVDSDEYDRTDLDKIRYKSPTDNTTVYTAEKPHESTTRQQALIIESYLRDDEQDEKKEQKRKIVDTEDGMKKEEIEDVYKHSKKYPKGRWVVTANKIVLQDGPNPYLDGKWPYGKYVNYILPHEYWGESEVQQLEGPQRTFNKIMSFVLDVLTLTGNPIIVMDTDTGIDPDEVYNRPGLIIEKNPGSEFRREPGVQLQPYVLQIMDRLKVWFDELSGTTDITRGVTPPGVKSGVALDTLQEAAQTRIRQKSRNLDVFLQDIGQQYASRVLQFYTAPRIVRITNNDQASKYFKFHVEQRGEETFAKVQDFTENEDGEMALGPERELQLRGKLDLKITTGSLLPFQRALKENRLLNFFDRGIIDEEEVLKGVDFPNWEKVIQRVQQRKEELMAQQQAQQQQPQ